MVDSTLPDSIAAAATTGGPPPLRELLAGDVVSAAAGLVGCILARRLDGPDGRVLRVQIVETEAYHMSEPGCHAYRGRTPRTEIMFGQPGQLYVYFTYGMWHCANVVCEPAGTAAAVLLRAAVAMGGAAATEAPRLSGPGLFCRGLELDRRHNGLQLLSRNGQVWLYRPRGWQPPPLAWSPRIGLNQARELPWRCCWRDHPALSRR
jgi:DNA-3-methyladenine glycosylase